MRREKQAPVWNRALAMIEHQGMKIQQAEFFVRRIRRGRGSDPIAYVPFRHQVARRQPPWTEDAAISSIQIKTDKCFVVNWP